MSKYLKSYLSEQGLTEAAFGARLGKSQQTVHGWATGHRIPRPTEMVRIYVVTRGAVCPNDFYDLPELETAEAAA